MTDPPSERSAGGRLIVVPTPIGNLDDLSPRARAAFETADLVACEDTRRTGSLLANLGLKRPLISLHDHNERQRLPRMLEELENGATVALVSDAGTPLLSDPGFVLVREAAAAGIRIESLPGPSAILTALVASALPPLPFTFGGFTPRKSGKRQTFYREMGALGHTVILFESPRRLLDSLDDAREACGDRPVAVARELTKTHEEVLRGNISEVIAALEEKPAVKGEIVIVLGGPPKGSK